MKSRARRLVLASLLALQGCTNLHQPISTDTIGYAVTYADVMKIGLLVAAVYYVSDPMAPTWEIVETRLPDQRVIYRLQKQFLSIGGDGEAAYVLRRRADAFAREQNMAGYQIERYEEAVDNRILLPRRTAYAEVRLLPQAL